MNELTKSDLQKKQDISLLNINNKHLFFYLIFRYLILRLVSNSIIIANFCSFFLMHLLKIYELLLLKEIFFVLFFQMELVSMIIY